MAKTFKVLSLLLTISLAVTITAQSQGQVPAPESAASPGGPMLDCTNELMNMSACLTYVEEGSNLTRPDKGCCPSLSSLVNNNPVCLCQLLAKGDIFGVKIDTKKALKMPTACKVDTPSVSLCSAIGVPVASSLGPSPAPATSGVPGEPAIGVPVASSLGPSPAPATSGVPGEPGSNPTTVISAMSPPTAAPPSTNTGTRATTTFMAPLTITLFIISLL